MPFDITDFFITTKSLSATPHFIDIFRRVFNVLTKHFILLILFYFSCSCLNIQTCPAVRLSSRVSKNNPSSSSPSESARSYSAPYQVPKGLRDGPPPLSSQVPLTPKASEIPSDNSGKPVNKNKKQKVTQVPKDTAQVVVDQTPAPTPMEVDNTTTTSPELVLEDITPSSNNPKAESHTYDASLYQAAAKDATKRVQPELPLDRTVIQDQQVRQPNTSLEESMHAPQTVPHQVPVPDSSTNATSSSTSNKGKGKATSPPAKKIVLEHVARTKVFATTSAFTDMNKTEIRTCIQNALAKIQSLDSISFKLTRDELDAEIELVIVAFYDPKGANEAIDTIVHDVFKIKLHSYNPKDPLGTRQNNMDDSRAPENSNE